MTEPRKLARRSRVVRKTQAKAIPKFLTSSRTITSSVSQLLYSWCRHRHCNRHIVQQPEQLFLLLRIGFIWVHRICHILIWVMKNAFDCPTRVRGKTFPEKLLSSIISLTLTSAGYWALFSCKKIQLLFCIDRARYQKIDLDKRLIIADVYLLV